MHSLVPVDEPNTLKYTLFSLIQKLFQGLILLDLATASTVARGNATDLQALLHCKAKITGDQLKIMEVTKLELIFLIISGSLSPHIGNLSSWKHWDLCHHNSLRGSIPPSLGNLSYLEKLDLIYIALSGIITEALGKLTNHSFFSAAGNAMYGVPVTMFNLSNIRVFDIDGNKIQGMNRLGHGREGDLKFLYTLVNNTKLTFLSIRLNNFGGELPECISNFSSTLEGLGMEINRIWGRIPNGIVNLNNLEALGVYQNQLSGLIPFEIGKLKIVYAHGNFLFGTIPHSIGNFTELTKLTLDFNNLQGNIPSSFGNCQNLLGMSLSHNNLSGPIPPQVLGIPSMSIMLDLSSNDLTGELPVAVGYMKNLAELYVSKIGPIPSSLSSLKGLEAFNVSDNNLSGEIFEFLLSFRALKYLNLSSNDFEGVIPNEGVFKNASATFVEGINKLCGGIPELHLSRCNKKTSPNTSPKLKIAIVIVTLGVTLVFTCLLILWFRKKRERKPTTTCAENSFLQLSYQSILRATDSGATIAVKVLNLLNRGASRSFLAECELWHPFTGDVYRERPTDETFKGLSHHIFVKEAFPNQVVEIIDPILLQENVREGIITDITRNANRMGNESHLHCLNSIFEIGLTCSAESPSERTDMSDVVTKLCSILDKLLRPTRLRHGMRTPYTAQSAGI
ncbi:hypothetical protein F3Y22_tig00112114pilonHSYRG00225 [Hibiscus syriacus]|uniref:Uncharacterized protein n=1 Tax=Hibiscus syriacus TaxID=106335 RepID=A0A6A2XVC8_HIBSY|nr:hypothetical protein F3Y22_tig00112114pilonHSYRG00225 [Hibiscus syriacus]